MFSVWTRLFLFLFASIGIAYLSKSSIRLPLKHGFPRLVAWEAILALFLLNVPCWFCDPFSIFQIFSWLFLIVSIPLILSGIWFLHAFGRPDVSREGEALLGIEKTTILVTTGIYRYIRHPFYASLLYLSWGIFFKDISLPGLFLAIVASISLLVTALVEEQENIEYFGVAYPEYIKKTKRFIPFIF